MENISIEEAWIKIASSMKKSGMSFKEIEKYLLIMKECLFKGDSNENQ